MEFYSITPNTQGPVGPAGPAGPAGPQGPAVDINPQSGSACLTGNFTVGSGFWVMLAGIDAPITEDPVFPSNGSMSITGLGLQATVTKIYNVYCSVGIAGGVVGSTVHALKVDVVTNLTDPQTTYNTLYNSAPPIGNVSVSGPLFVYAGQYIRTWVWQNSDADQALTADGATTLRAVSIPT